MKNLMLKKEDLKELAEEKKKNFKYNMQFIELQAKFVTRTTNKEWSRQQKRFIDSVHAANRRLRIKFR